MTLIGTYDLSPVLSCRVLGKPVPQGAVRHFGRGRPSAYTNQRDLLPWREQCQHSAEVAVDALDKGAWELPLTGPVGLVCHFTVSKPAARPKTRASYPQARPDTSKLTRSVEDALVAAGVYKDDAQIVFEVASKSYPNETPDALHVPGVMIYVFTVSLPKGYPPGVKE